MNVLNKNANRERHTNYIRQACEMAITTAILTVDDLLEYIVLSVLEQKMDRDKAKEMIKGAELTSEMRQTVLSGYANIINSYVEMDAKTAIEDLQKECQARGFNETIRFRGR